MWDVGTKQKKNLLRLTIHRGDLTFDEHQRLGGRGIYICKSISCINKAFQLSTLERGLRHKVVSVQKDELKLMMLTWVKNPSEDAGSIR